MSEENKYVCSKGFDLKDYLSSKIKVFKGKKTEVCLKCKSKHMKAILDYFGHEIKTTNAEKGFFNAIIEIELSPKFGHGYFSLKAISSFSLLRKR